MVVLGAWNFDVVEEEIYDAMAIYECEMCPWGAHWFAL